MDIYGGTISSTLSSKVSRVNQSTPFESMDWVTQKLDKDIITYVLSLLQTPKDLANSACVCHSWHKTVIEGELWRKLCLKISPEIGQVCRRLKGGGHLEDLFQTQEVTYLQAKRSPYAILLKKLLSPPLQRTCICEPLHASSTDNLPEESIAHTLYPGSFYVDHMWPSCWSSKGEASKSVPEILTYRLVSDICVVYTIKVRPTLVYYQFGNPIYSSEMIRFRFGYSRSASSLWSGFVNCLSYQRADIDDYVWTYVSPTFHVAQEDTLQTFELPKPILCIGGILQIELIGRVQIQRSDGLYYFGITYVHVTGRPLSTLKLDSIDEEGQYVFRKLCPEEKPSTALPLLKSLRLFYSVENLINYFEHGLNKYFDSEEDEDP